MTVGELEQRVAVLEREIAELRQLIGQSRPPRRAWETTFGIFANCPEFDEAVRLGREYRDQVNRESLEESE
jgi:hypothetical protein